MCFHEAKDLLRYCVLLVLVRGQSPCAHHEHTLRPARCLQRGRACACQTACFFLRGRWPEFPIFQTMR
jgi:hypothetical protein